MRLNKKQEKAIDTAYDVMHTVLSSGIDRDEDGAISEAMDELLLMKIKSLKAKENEKIRKHWDNFVEHSDTITLDAQWYDRNVRNK